MLDAALEVVHGDRVADDERLVEHDRERREQVGEDVLQRERDRDAADAESGEDAAGLEAEVLGADQEQGDPDDDLRGDAECRDRGAVEIAVTPGVVLDPPRDQPRSRLRTLQDGDERRGDQQQAVHSGAEVEPESREAERDDRDERPADAPGDLDERVVDERLRPRGERGQAMHHEPAQQQDAASDGERAGRRDGPIEERVAEQRAVHPVWGRHQDGAV